MPLGFERLNERSQRPNALINFIRPLPGQTAPTAEKILNRVAAICYPFMKKHMVLVQALEEFPYNNEFVGRNFNAGEVIQLVLRNRQGQWLPERWVMMVMVHELAHCKQMNHSKAFWKVRNEYAEDLKDLWQKGYTGEGLWGRGRNLDSGRMQSGSTDVGDVPEHLCGGTYGRRSKRKRGRKTKENMSYAERKQRRILKKFGAGGQALGEDEATKVKLEGGVAKKGKPRVAGSARGRELRAAAALARFDTSKKEEVTIKEEELDSDTDDDYEDVDEADAAFDIDGTKLVDNKGRALVKICEDDNENDGEAKREMEEIQEIDLIHERPTKLEPPLRSKQQPPGVKSISKKPVTQMKEELPSNDTFHRNESHKNRPASSNATDAKANARSSVASTQECSICSLVNEPGTLICAVCSHVLNLHLAPDHWNCAQQSCNTKYINSGDAGICGLCGSSRRDS
ncbi:WLM-domain-containing protein [Aaosphaeria arxii CBS 175.79]|uniref:WLM-domain-containing protein n=1 Tax=Aaosphaeria arxii CBS 175.79 TaxID=1450172 RepID=A0A6A5XEV3_9PLEO|nr:WLM-domain-containing protein [Aaosphaeria arxii CBS 175.79]KAF2011622.1 WLM-domain-containing protein [Aaosphaeria arxii CBS 175.79]